MNLVVILFQQTADRRITSIPKFKTLVSNNLTSRDARMIRLPVYRK